MKMYKVIKEFKENEFTYKLGYYLLKDNIYPRIEIYKNNKLLSGGGWGVGTYAGSFAFGARDSLYTYNGSVGTIKELFIELRKYSDIPEYIEKEFEELFIMYKLNDFRED